MRLFGYTERDFEKNTKAFKRELEEMIQICSANPENDDRIRFEFISILYQLVKLGDTVRYRKGRGRDYKAIDAEIKKLLEDIGYDVREENIVAGIVLSDLLAIMIEKGRNYREVTHTGEEIEAYHYLADALDQMYDLSARIVDIDNKQLELIQKADGALPSERLQYRLNFEDLEGEKHAINERIKQLYAQYTSAMDVIGREKMLCRLDDFSLNDVLYFRSFEKKIYDASRSLADEIYRLVFFNTPEPMPPIYLLNVGDVENTFDLLAKEMDERNGRKDKNVDIQRKKPRKKRKLKQYLRDQAKEADNSKK